jgi:coenzyme F420 biosynthesis associated uncharacterized protein
VTRGRSPGRDPGRRQHEPRERRHTRGARPFDDRIWRVGFLVGSAIGAAITVAGRHVEHSARTAGLVDWPRVEAIATARLRRARGALSVEELRAVEPLYADAMARVVPALSEHLETDLPGVVDRVAVVDRAGWVRANTVSFATLMSKLEGDILDQIVPPGGGFTRAAMALTNRWVTTRQLGLLLGFMGQRVLGQYDLALLSAESTPGRLLFVEENIRQTARALDVPLNPFRTWIALHETTHAYEFEAHAWLRPYLAERLERQLTLFSQDTASLGREAAKGLGRALRGEGRGDDMHWMERLMGDEQRRLFRETQAVMSILEGFGDHVMDAVGRDLVPGVERISEKFHARRQRRTGVERAVLRLTGLDLKMEQYRKGEEFVAAIDRAAGAPALRRLWEGPETMPTHEELGDPGRWLRRMGFPGGLM